MSLATATPISVYRDRRRTPRRIALAVCCTLLILLGLSVAFVAVSALTAKDAGADARLLEIPSGSGTDDIAAILIEQGIVSNRTGFTVAVLISGARGQLQAGTYELSPAMSPLTIVNLMRSGQTKEHKVTIPEGLRLNEIAERVAEAGVIGREDFLAATRQEYDMALLNARPDNATLEGYLFPDTYSFPEGTTAREVVEEMLQNFQQKVSPLFSEIEASGRTLHQVVTLASIVEAEVPRAEDRPKVARVLFNRLGQDMRLQADSTVAYALEVRRLDLSAEELATEHPFNTYVNKGLPPGPINSPSLESLRAVLEPAEADALYFVSNPDTGETFFADTLEEHEKNISQVFGDQP